jgi:hypothetical protein
MKPPMAGRQWKPGASFAGTATRTAIARDRLGLAGHPAFGSRSFVKPNPRHNGEEHVMATNKPIGDNTRKGAVKKRSQLATKTMGKKTFTKRNKEGGQFMAQKKKTKFKGVRKER